MGVVGCHVHGLLRDPNVERNAHTLNTAETSPNSREESEAASEGSSAAGPRSFKTVFGGV